MQLLSSALILGMSKSRALPPVAVRKMAVLVFFTQRSKFVSLGRVRLSEMVMPT